MRCQAFASVLTFATLVACRAPSRGHPAASASAPVPVASVSKETPKPESKSAAVAPVVRTVLHAARALDPKSGKTYEPAFVELRGGEIASVGTNAPPDATSMTELGDVTILPGFVDAHAHLLHLEGVHEHAILVEATTLSDADRALRGAVYARQMLEAGFTTVRDLGNSGHGADVSLRNAIRKGWAVGPTIVAATRALSHPGGQFPRVLPQYRDVIDREYAVVRSPTEATTLVRQAIYEGADCIKLIVDSPSSNSMTLDEVRAATEAAHAAGKKVAAHAVTEKGAALAVTAGVDSLEHAYEIKTETLVEMARKHIFLVPTDYPLEFYDRYVPQDDTRASVIEQLKKFRKGSSDRLARAFAAKVPIAFGSDMYVETELRDRGKDAALSFRAYSEAGLPPLAIVRAVTSSAAELVVSSPKAGTLSAGAPADVIAVRGNPLVDSNALTEVVFVAKAGKIVRAPASAGASAGAGSSALVRFAMLAP